MAFIGIITAFAFIDFNKKPLFLQRISYFIIPLLGVVLYAGVVREVRLFLPASMTLIPSALFLFKNSK